MLSDFTALGVFIKYSPKRQRCLETCTAVFNSDQRRNGKPEVPVLKLKLLSATRWVERHTSILDFMKIYEAVMYCLDVISGQSPVPSVDVQTEAGVSNPEEISKFDAKSVTEANGLLRALSSDSFIVALHCSLFASGYLKSLSVLLQGSHLDIIEAYSEISRTRELLQEHRDKAEESFRKIFDSASAMTALFGRESPLLSRVVPRQTLRSNIPASAPEPYWRAAVFIPFLDSLIAELGSRFTALTQKAVEAFLLLPANLEKLEEHNLSNIFSAYKVDLPDELTFNAEMERWQAKWKSFRNAPTQQPLPATLQDTIKATNQLSFPNIARILHLLLIIPVTSANVERANSALKFVKTDLRSRMSQARLNALVLLYCHKSVTLNHESVLNRFARAQPRRILLLNPVQEVESDERDIVTLTEASSV